MILYEMLFKRRGLRHPSLAGRQHSPPLSAVSARPGCLLPEYQMRARATRSSPTETASKLGRVLLIGACYANPSSGLVELLGAVPPAWDSSLCSVADGLASPSDWPARPVCGLDAWITVKTTVSVVDIRGRQLSTYRMQQCPPLVVF